MIIFRQAFLRERVSNYMFSSLFHCISPGIPKECFQIIYSAHCLIISRLAFWVVPCSRFAFLGVLTLCKTLEESQRHVFTWLSLAIQCGVQCTHLVFITMSGNSSGGSSTSCGSNGCSGNSSSSSISSNPCSYDNTLTVIP